VRRSPTSWRDRQPAARADRLLIGGGMSFTSWRPRARGRQEPARADQLDIVQGLPRAGAGAGVEIVLPIDVVAARRVLADAEHDVVWRPIPADRMGLDIGPSRARSSRPSCRRAHRVLERPDGRVRDAALRRGHHGGRAGVSR
jgi:3-phosphoglycerate kinase